MNSKILLVDDDVAVVAALSGVFRSEGYDIIQAFNGQQALEYFREVSGAALVLLDLNMPVKGGWATFERLIAINPLLPIIVITACPDQAAHAEAAGVDALMEKPLDIPLLLETVRALLAETSEARHSRTSQRNSHPSPLEMLGTHAGNPGGTGV